MKRKGIGFLAAVNSAGKAASAILLMLLLSLSLWDPRRIDAQFATPIIDGTINPGEYGMHMDGANQQCNGGTCWFMTWDDTNLYIGITGANTAEGAVVYIDSNPVSPPRGGNNTNGNLTGQTYDNTGFAQLPFRADFVSYFKDGYREYRTATGTGAWSAPVTFAGSYASSAGTNREISIPWSAITGGGRPSSFDFFGYVTSSGGFVYGQVPPENPGGFIGTAATYDRYYAVSSTTNGASTKPFSQNRSASSSNTFISVDSSSQNCASDTIVGVSTLSWSHTVGNGTNRFLVVGVSTTTNLVALSSPRVTSVTYGGVALTRIGTQTAPDMRSAIEMFQLDDPPSGTAAIVVNTIGAGVNFIVGGATSFSGVGTTGPFASSSGSTGDPTVTVISAANDVVIDTVGTLPNGFLAAGPGQTERWNGFPSCFFGSFSVGAGSTEPGAMSVTMSWLISSSQPWAIGAVTLKPAIVTDARVINIEATRYGNRALLKWQTGHDVDNLGFNVYRDENGKRTRINPELIAGSALQTGHVTLMADRSYVWADQIEKATDALNYTLESVNVSGGSTWHGPVAPHAGSALTQRRDAELQSALLSSLGATGGRSRPAEPKAALPVDIPTNGRVRHAVIAPRTNLAAQTAVKISVNSEGWYRVSQSQLLAAGLNPLADPRLLRLFVDGTELAIRVSGENDGRLDPPDAVEFYGLGLDTPYTDYRTYWLVADSVPGMRISTFNGAGGASVSSWFPSSVEREDNTIYFSSLRNGEAENFFGAVVANSPLAQSLELEHVFPATEPAVLEVALQGVTLSNHRVRIQINESDVGELNFYGHTLGVARMSVAHSLLREGENIVQLTSQDSGDVSLVDYVRITYSHSYTADGDFLRLTALGGEEVTVSGFSNSSVQLFDVTDPNLPQRVASTIKTSSDGITITGTVPGVGQRVLLAFTDEKVRHPAGVTANTPSKWKQPAQGWQFLIIARREFFPALDPLRTLRQSQGLTVSVIDVEDIYDEFSYGHKSPAALKAFLDYAASSWKRPARYVLLAGDASADARNYLGYGDNDLVPSKLIDTFYLETSSDDWLADFNDDGVPELAIGRLPARTAGELGRMVNRIKSYDQAGTEEIALLVADAGDGFDFEQANAQLRPLIPANLRVEEVLRGRMEPAAAKAFLLDRINAGPRIVTYSGHGSASLWRGNLLTNSDLPELNNSRLPVFIMMTCLNGYFQDPLSNSLAEALVKADEGGAVAAWASSGLCEPGGQAVLNYEFFRLLFGGSNGRGMMLGEAARTAKQAVADTDIRRTWILLGDPTMRLR